MLDYFQLDPYEQTPVKFFESMKTVIQDCVDENVVILIRYQYTLYVNI